MVAAHTPSPDRKASRMNLVVAGCERGIIELRQTLSTPGELLGWIFLPATALLVMFLLQDQAVPGTDLSIGTQALPGIVGTNVVLIGVLGLATVLTADRADGTLLRSRTLPQGMQGYLIGKIVGQGLMSLVIVTASLLVGGLLFDGLVLNSPHTWLTLAWVLALGLLATLPLGALLGALFRTPQSLSFASLLFMGLVSISGVFYPLAALPGWLQVVGQLSPVYWLGLGMRSALLPDSAALLEVGGTWRAAVTAVALLAWAVLGLLVAPRVLRRLARRAPAGTRLTDEPREQAVLGNTSTTL